MTATGQTTWPLAEVLLGPLHVEGFFRDFSFGEVDSQYLFGPRHDNISSA